MEAAWTAGFVGPKEDDNIPPEVRVCTELGPGCLHPDRSVVFTHVALALSIAKGLCNAI
jgi:hypothetical protein